MDQVVAQALSTYARMVEGRGRARALPRAEPSARSELAASRRRMALPARHASREAGRRAVRELLPGRLECSTHRRRDGRRLDLIAATGHDRAVVLDYRAMLEHGIRTVRDGVRWHLIETMPGRYDWSSFLPMLRAEEVGVQVIWDLCHYGWPDHLDIWRPQFVDGFARFAAAVAAAGPRKTDRVPLWCLINEISYGRGPAARSRASTRTRAAAAPS